LVEYTFNFQGYTFQEGVKVLQRSFESAIEALAGDVERAKEEAVAYQESVDRGGEWVGERDEDGHVIWDQADVLTFDVEAAEDAAMALRKAFVIAAYHHWERSARSWTGSAINQHDGLAALVAAKGLPIHPKLDAVRFMVNTLKHDKEYWAKKLHDVWSDVFSPDLQPHPVKTDWYEAVRLRDKHVLEAFAVVAASGPSVGTA
jgi:hypothetical protein